MIKVKSFDTNNSDNPHHHERLDNSINAFISSNDIEIIDIKYSTAMAYTGVGYAWKQSALLIYKEN